MHDAIKEFILALPQIYMEEGISGAYASASDPLCPTFSQKRPRYFFVPTFELGLDEEGVFVIDRKLGVTFLVSARIITEFELPIPVKKMVAKTPWGVKGGAGLVLPKEATDE